jgi:class I fructose-bisphosphate aldolase
MTYQQITELLGKENENLFSHICKKILRETLHLPSPHFIDDVFTGSNRNLQTLRSLQQLFNNGRLAGTGYLSILPVDQGGNTVRAPLAKSDVF